MQFRFGIREAAFFVIAMIVVATGLSAPFLLGAKTITVAPVITTGTGPQGADSQNSSLLSSSPPPRNVGAFKNYTQLEDFIAANSKNVQQQNYPSSFNGNGVATVTMMETMSSSSMSEASSTAAGSASTPSYTGTNVQVAGVDEPDTVKTDGLHIFVASVAAVTIINAYPPTSAAIASTLSYPNEQVLGIEIAPNRLAVINQRNTNATYIDLLLYDTTHLSSPKLMENASIAGNYVSARLSDGYLYAIIQQPSFQYGPYGNLTGVMPVVTENTASRTLAPSSVFYTDNWAQISYYTMVVSLSMTTGQERTISILTGESSTIYVSTSNIYVVYDIVPMMAADGIPGDVYTGGMISSDMVSGQNTSIFRAAYSNGVVVVQAAGEVPGTILNQFSLDEYNGYFRVATSRFATINNVATTSDDVYVLNENLSLVSSIKNIAPGENIYAVRFVGDQGYVVTFQQVDPLFVISFMNMTHPVIESALKMNGYSDYLQPLPGGYLLGIGKDTVPASDGNYSYYLGLKMSLFKVYSNGSTTQISKYVLGDRGTESPALTDHLAFTYDPTKNITVIPVLLAQVSGNQSTGPNGYPLYGDPVYQGAYVFRVNSTGIVLLGRVTQYQNYADSPVNNLDIYRTIIIGNYLYTISQGEVMVSSLADFSTVATISLPTTN